MMNERQNPCESKDEVSDVQLCAQAQNGSPDATEQLIHRYSKLVKACARSYFMEGADSDDLVQEGMIGLLRAVRQFDVSRGVPFEAFARLCVTRQIYSAVRAAAAQKHEILNHSITIEKPLFDDNAASRISVNHIVSNPEALVIGMEEQQERIQQLLKSLSAFEAKVLRLYLQGCTYQEMTGILQKPLKSVDNAIQRIKRKSAEIKC